jgi:hypothetical protein
MAIAAAEVALGGLGTDATPSPGDAAADDAGSWRTANLESCEQRGLAGCLHHQQPLATSPQRPRPSRERPAKDFDSRGRMDRSVRSKVGQVICAQIKTALEPLFCKIKGAYDSFASNCKDLRAKTAVEAAAA